MHNRSLSAVFRNVADFFPSSSSSSSFHSPFVSLTQLPKLADFFTICTIRRVPSLTNPIDEQLPSVCVPLHFLLSSSRYKNGNLCVFNVIEPHMLHEFLFELLNFSTKCIRSILQGTSHFCFMYNWFEGQCILIVESHVCWFKGYDFNFHVLIPEGHDYSCNGFEKTVFICR